MSDVINIKAHNAMVYVAPIASEHGKVFLKLRAGMGEMAASIDMRMPTEDARRLAAAIVAACEKAENTPA